ncbi:MAG: ribosome maturation factor RimP [Omnitrophica bacterium]|nr:ribosome maturation factor RimP [Candidatus Omnitrophota bacterium]
MHILEQIKELIAPEALERKYYIVDVTYKREGKNFVLRILADKEGGITMDECAEFNNAIGELLDKKGVIEDKYTIEVSSPGLDRRLVKDGDFVWAMDKRVKITTYAPLDGKSAFSGRLLGLGKDTVVIGEDAASTEIPREKIASAKVDEIASVALQPRNDDRKVKHEQ